MQHCSSALQSPARRSTDRGVQWEHPEDAGATETAGSCHQDHGAEGRAASVWWGAHGDRHALACKVGRLGLFPPVPPALPRKLRCLRGARVEPPLSLPLPLHQLFSGLIPTWPGHAALDTRTPQNTAQESPRLPSSRVFVSPQLQRHL